MVSSFGRSLLADLIWRRLFQDGGHVEIIIIYIFFLCLNLSLNASFSVFCSCDWEEVLAIALHKAQMV